MCVYGTGDQDQKNLQDIIEALTLIGNMRDDVNTILDNVGKSNPTNPYASAYQSFKTLAESQAAAEQTTAKAPGQSSASALSEADQNQLNEFSEKFANMDPEQLQYFEQTDSKYLMDRVSDISKNLGYLNDHLASQRLQTTRELTYNFGILGSSSES